MDAVHNTCHALLNLHNAEKQVESRRQLKEKILHSLPDVDFCCSCRIYEPECLCSNAAKSIAIDDKLTKKDVSKEMQTLFDCSKMVRQEILKAHKDTPWKFKGSLTRTCTTPQMLKTLLRWIIVGPLSALKTAEHEDSLNTSIKTISHNIMYATKSNRQLSYDPKTDVSLFRHRNENPQVLGLELAVHHFTRSKADIKLLHKFGHTVDYNRILRAETQIANTIIRQMRETHGVYVPKSLQKDRIISFAIDNLDFSEDTPDGKNTLHATATTVYQQKYENDPPVKELVLDQTDSSSKSLKDATYYRAKLEPCSISGNPKPRNTHFYKNFTALQNSEDLNEYHIKDVIWLMTKTSSKLSYKNCIEEHPYISEEMPETRTVSTPTRSAYNSLCASNSQPLTNVCLLPLLNAPANDWQTLITVLKHAQKINVEIMGPKRKTVVTFDMALYERACRL